MAQEQPRTIGEALEHARAARMDNHDRVVMDQIADALISIQWWMERIATSLEGVRSDQTRIRSAFSL
jgi:hypothetical protein